MSLHGKRILLGVTGSIAAYKAASLVRLLIKSGAEVKVIMTTSASAFITPLTLATLSKNPVLTEFVKNESGEWNNHVELGLWADIMLIAPLTATTLAKMSQGQSDNLLTATYLSARCPVVVCPAMDLDMYQHPSVIDNLQKIQSYGNQVIAAEHGELASGLEGQGRMAEPEHIVEYLRYHFAKNTPLKNRKVLVTAGPTYEPIDPVRFIGNHSSGKMGFAIADALATAGAEVHLVHGPTHERSTQANIRQYAVTSAAEMYGKCLEIFPKTDAAILSAAVADFTPKAPAKEKIKKQAGEDKMSIELIKTTDIARELGTLKKVHQVIVGFALETENELNNAQEKLQRKNFDFIVLNSLKDEGAGFGHDTNKVTLIFKDEQPKSLPLLSKSAIAKEIVQEISRIFSQKS